jgi:NADH dehydrogenase
VTAISAEGVTLDNGEFVPGELIVWAAGIKAPDFLADLDGLETDRLNRLVVRDTLQTTRDPDIFAIGDCACLVPEGENEPLPPRAQVAHQQASLLVKSVAYRLKGRPLPRFRYRDFGSLVSLSSYQTLGHLIGGLHLEGLFARLAYRSLLKMHEAAIHGPITMVLSTIARSLSRSTEPRIKLH